MPAQYPDDWLTLINDGASQQWYQVPRLVGLDHGRTACKCVSSRARAARAHLRLDYT